MAAEDDNGLRRIGAARAVIASICGPGLGYVYLGRMRLAFVPLLAGIGTMAVAGWTRLIFVPAALYVFAVAALTILVFPIVHCALLALRERLRPARAYNRWWFYLLWIGGGILLAGALVDIRAMVFGFEPFRIPSTSMAPTIEQGDFVMTDTWHYGRTAPRYGDLVVFRLPASPDVMYVKRVVGLPGDRIEIRADVLYRNGKAVEEDHVRIDAQGPGAFGDFAVVTVPDDHYFVLGDNRRRSRDSRFTGAIPASHLHGFVVLRWFAWDHGIRWERFPEVLANDAGRT